VSRRLLVASLGVTWALAALSQVPLPGPDYRIGPGDLIAIEVFEEPGLAVERRVAADGAINLPLLGDVTVGGLSPDGAAERIATALEASYLQRATVTIEVKEFLSQEITVLGAVAKPGSLYMSSRWTLFQALTAAGGLTADSGNSIYVLRRAANGLSDQLEIGVDDLLVRGDAAVNVPLQAHDVVNVPLARTVTVYFLGEVATPGAVTLTTRSPVTLLTAIARAGGLTERAADRITVKRKQSDGTTVELEASYDQMLAGNASDLELMEGDLLVVKESFF
jgi:polysaccharide export outer membrane protein